MALDKQALFLTKSILKTETGGQKDPYNTKGASGEFGAYQFMPTTYKNLARQHLGDENAQPTMENQNKIAYSEVKRLKDSGYSPAQVASYWNSGKKDAYKNGLQGVNSQGVAFDVSGYVKKVSKNYRDLSGVKQAPAPTPTAEPTPEKEGYQPTFEAKEGQTILEHAGTTIGNIPKSAFEFAKGIARSPYEIGKNIGNLPGAFKRRVEAEGGVLPAITESIKDIPSAAYKTLVPKAAKQAFKGEFEQARQTIAEDPVGQIAPFVLAGRGLLGKTKLGKTVDKGIAKTGQLVTKPVGYVAKKIGGGIASTTKSTIGQAIGVPKSTIEAPIKHPKAFSPKQMKKFSDRESLGAEIETKINVKKEAFSETGKAYAPIRKQKSTVKVEPDFLDKSIKETTGLKIVEGKLKASTTSKIRDKGDVRAIQETYDFWNGKFKEGILKSDEFLNFRTDLGKMAKFEKEIGKRQGVATSAGQIRAKFNQKYRSQIKGLEQLDKKSRAQRLEIEALSENLFYKSGVKKGQLKDNASDIIATSLKSKTVKKQNLVKQLEEISPGITKKIEILEAIENIQKAGGFGSRFGISPRAALTGTAFVSGGPILGIVSAILTSPKVAIPLLRQYGLLKNSKAVNAVIQGVREGAGLLNEPTKKIAPYAGSVIGSARKNPKFGR